jgi:hypothetical protein
MFVEGQSAPQKVIRENASLEAQNNRVPVGFLFGLRDESQNAHENCTDLVGELQRW